MLEIETRLWCGLKVDVILSVLIVLGIHKVF